MRRFEVPTISIQRLDDEDFVRTSGCFQIFTCENCYCAIVTCPSGFSCSSLKCTEYTHRN